MNQIFFYSDEMELRFRSPNPWHVKWFPHNADTDLNRVWNFLHTLEGQIGIRTNENAEKLSKILQFEKLSDKTKFDMYSKLSNWERPIDYSYTTLDHIYPHIVSKKFLMSSILNISEKELDETLTDDPGK